MKVKTSELTGAALDWAVAKSLGGRYAQDIKYQGCGDGAFLTVDKSMSNAEWDDAEEWCPSESWYQGGPVIEQNRIWVCASVCDGVNWFSNSQSGVNFYGPTPLTAAMRCFVSSKLGNEIEVPDELADTVVVRTPSSSPTPTSATPTSSNTSQNTAHSDP